MAFLRRDDCCFPVGQALFVSLSRDIMLPSVKTMGVSRPRFLYIAEAADSVDLTRKERPDGPLFQPLSNLPTSRFIPSQDSTVEFYRAQVSYPAGSLPPSWQRSRGSASIFL